MQLLIVLVGSIVLLCRGALSLPSDNHEEFGLTLESFVLPIKTQVFFTVKALSDMIFICNTAGVLFPL